MKSGATPRWRLRIAAVVLAAAGLAAAAEQALPPIEAGKLPIAETRHEVAVGGRTLRYTARAGLLPIRANETGEIHASVYFTAYVLDPAAGAPPRPLTFLWNGGPGANSVLVHLVGFGPRRIRMADSSLDPPGCDCELVANDGTWLEATDLVFVDPVGTGFSRLARPELGDEFYSVLSDTAATTEFIRLYLTRFDAWDQPLFVGGESYGTWRAAGVALALEQREIPVAGTILISGGVPVGPVEEEEMRVALLLTARTAAAFHHRKLHPELLKSLDTTLAEAESWARTAYAPALARRDGLTPADRQGIVGGLSRYTSLLPSQIDAEALVINRGEFAKLLLASENRELARFDTRQVIGGSAPPDGARAKLVGRYLREELDVPIDLAYQGLETGYRPVTEEGAVGPAARWRYNQAPPDEKPPARLTTGDGPPGNRPAWLRQTIEENPDHRVFVATGHFDSLNSCALNRHLVDRLDAGMRDNFTMACYSGGHMMYEDRGNLLQMKSDVTRFIAETVGAPDRRLGSGSSQASPPVTHAIDRGVVTSRQAIELDARSVTYTARAGTLPIRHNETGEPRARMFFVSYSLPPRAGAPPRPLVFAWNGGPGSNAGLLHVTAMGPRRLRMDDVYPDADHDRMNVMVDNEATWLAFADLVFVDPVGTGYSRPTRDEYGPEFYDTTGDVESVAEFIRVYRTRFGAWDQTVFLVGESYGSRRAAAVTLTLLRQDIDVAGVVLVSGNLGIVAVPEHLSTALLVPSYTATALYHRKLADSLQQNPDRTMTQVEAWAKGEYASALERLDNLTASERNAIRERLSRFVGLPVEAIDPKALAVPMPTFAEQLLRETGRVLGRYDSRLSRARKSDERMFDPTEDASLAPLEGKMSGGSPAMNRYLRNVLGFESDLLYVGPFGGAWPPPERFRGDWMSVRWNRSRPGPDEPLREAMAANPDLRAFEAAGIYDLVVPSLPPAYVIEHLEPELRGRFTVRAYVGGHSFYLDRASRLQFTRDARAFIERPLAGRSAR
jgi:carboxypeptidase C (cathepsin A)